jgi:hypothetical protein
MSYAVGYINSYEDRNIRNLKFAELILPQILKVGVTKSTELTCNF